MEALRINSTGIRSGETIVASPSGKQNAGTVMKIRIPGLSSRDLVYSPAKSLLPDSITIRDALSRFKFFQPMTAEERSDYLLKHAIDNDDVYLQEVPGLEVNFISIGGQFFTKTLSQDQLAYLMKAGYIPIVEVYNMFPRKPGSKAFRHTLIFRPSNWVLAPDAVEPKGISGLVYDIDTLTVNQVSNAVYKIAEEVPAVGVVPEFTVVSNSHNDRLSTEQVLNLGREVIPSLDLSIKDVISWFPPSLHKSLIQKLIRTRCLSVTHLDKTYEASHVLVVSFSMLLAHPGSFVPNLQKFVTGLEGATKRLAVSITEDSWTSDADGILSLLGVASLVSHEYFPSRDLIKSWMRLALQAQNSTYLFKYDWKEFEAGRQPLSNLDYWALSYELLSHLKSFPSDVALLGSIAHNSGVSRLTTPSREFETMQLTHCVDQHSYTDIVHHMSYISLKDDSDYSRAMRLIWDKVTGIRPREGQVLDSTDFVTFNIQKAQRLTWIRRSGQPKAMFPVLSEGSYEVKYSLDPEWISALVGPLEFKIGGRTAIAVLNSDDIKVVIKPNRTDKTVPELSEEDKAIVISQMKRSLASGVKAKSLSSLPQFSKSIIKLVREEFYVDDKPWEDVRHLTTLFPLHPEIKMSVELALTHAGLGVILHADFHLTTFITSLPEHVKQRLMVYLQNVQDKIELYHVARDGSGTEYSVHPTDTAVCQVLCSMCNMYPGILETTEGGWKVLNSAGMWMLRDKIRDLTQTTNKNEGHWVDVREDSRTLWAHQEEAVHALNKRLDNGLRGSIIWIPMGLGKTLIVLRHLLHRIKTGTLPQYIVYTLPSSAMDSVSKEFLSHNFKVHFVDMRKTSKSGANKLVANVINLVEHDHLRRGDLDAQIKALAGSTLFIVDEFHKTMNKTIRTSVALELASLCSSFIALTGSLIKDSNPNDLIAWLSMVVPYQVTPDNYWVAVCSLISNRVKTRVQILREDIDVPTDEAYSKLVPPSMGGVATALNFKEAVRYAYRLTQAELIKQVVSYVKRGETVFVNARDVAHQIYIRDSLSSQGIISHVITRDSPITLLPGDTRPIQVVISTYRHVEGYQLTKCRVALSEVVFSNQATRDQWEARINRIGQPSPWVKYITVHAGILSYIWMKYESSRRLSDALKAFAQEVNLEVVDVQRELL